MARGSPGAGVKDGPLPGPPVLPISQACSPTTSCQSFSPTGCPPGGTSSPSPVPQLGGESPNAGPSSVPARRHLFWKPKPGPRPAKLWVTPMKTTLGTLCRDTAVPLPSGSPSLPRAARPAGPPSSARRPSAKAPLTALRRDPPGYKPPAPPTPAPCRQGEPGSRATLGKATCGGVGALEAGLLAAPLCTRPRVTLARDSCASAPPPRDPRGTPAPAKSGSQARALGARAAAVTPRALRRVPGRGPRVGVGRLATSDPSGRYPRRSLRSRPCRGPGPTRARLPRGPRPAPLPPPRARRRPGWRAVSPSSGAGSRPRRRGRPWPQPAPGPSRVVARRARST